jgi:hypothetical protein
MAYQAHPSCDTPADSTVVWRYMDVLKFTSMLESGCLWFTRGDLLDDPREGQFTGAERNHLETFGDDAGWVVNLFNETRRQSFVNCWYGSDEESMAMWKLYGKGYGSVAVRSSVSAVKAALSSATQSVMVGQIKYLEAAESTWPNNVYGMLVRKVNAYRHESEIRLLIWHPNAANQFPESFNVTSVANLMADELRKRHWSVSDSELRHVCEAAISSSIQRGYYQALPAGVPIAIDPSALVEEVVVGPDEPEWVTNTIRGLAQRYGLQKPIRSSSLRYPSKT